MRRYCISGFDDRANPVGLLVSGFDPYQPLELDYYAPIAAIGRRSGSLQKRLFVHVSASGRFRPITDIETGLHIS